jgi:flagellar basal-body rod modification protein FlgD
MTIAAVANQQSQLAAAANNAAISISNTASSVSGASGSSATSSSTGANALGSLSTNFNSFLNLLMTQLQNQDPTSPLDSNQFTSELVQFSQVEQQISTNSSLGQLIQLTQAGDLTQASSMLGSTVTAQSNQIPLQNGKGQLTFTAPAAEPAAIAIYNAAGQQILNTSINAQQGANSWTWNGQDSTGATMPDGAYSVAVIGANSDGSTSALPFTVTGTATGVTSSNNSLSLSLGALSVPFTAVQSVNKTG